MSVLKKLFNGDICPVHTSIPETEEYKKALKTMYSYGNELEAGMTEEQKELLDKYLDAFLEVNSLVKEETFRQAFILGIEMQKELETKD